MKRFIYLMASIVSLFILAGCNAVSGNGDVVTESYDLGDFSNISVSGVGDLVLTFGETQSVTVTTDSNIIELIEVVVEGDTLDIGLASGNAISNPTELTYAVTVPELDTVTISGSADFIAEDLEGESLNIVIEGAADGELEDIEFDTLNVTVDGSGDVNASGEVTTLELVIEGAGEFNGFDLEVTEANVMIDGSGDANLNVSDTLSGRVEGSGDLTYRGEPDVDVEVDGSGELIRE